MIEGLTHSEDKFCLMLYSEEPGDLLRVISVDSVERALSLKQDYKSYKEFHLDNEKNFQKVMIDEASNWLTYLILRKFLMPTGDHLLQLSVNGEVKKVML